MLAATLQLTAFVIVAVAALRPTLRVRGLVALLGIAGATIALALSEDGPRSLEISHQFTAYVKYTVQQKTFQVETVSGIPALRWGLLLAGFCVGWATWLFIQRDGEPARAFGMPLALCWTGCGLQLLLEKAAGPVELFLPFNQAPDRALFPATIVGALLLARPGRKIHHLVFYLCLFVSVTRLPLAVFGTLATQNSWGTHLDVHGATYFVPPFGGIGIEARPGDSQQLRWMVWAPHLIFYPAIYMMSTGGVAFLALMMRRQQEADIKNPSS